MSKPNIEKVKIRAVHDDDLDSFLKKVGLFDKIKNEEIICCFCNCILSFKNFGGVFKENEKIMPFCQKTECYLEVLKRKDAIKDSR